MKQTDQNSINMWRVVINYLDTRYAVWNSNAFFSTAKAELEAALQEVESSFQTQVTASVGATRTKVALEQEAVREVSAVAKLARAHALHTGDELLAAAVDISKSRLLRLPDAELLTQLRNILRAAEPIAADLTAMGLPGLAPAREATEAFATAVADPRTAIADRAAATSDIPGIIKKGRIALEKLDNVVHVFDQNSPGFSSGYKPCRVTVDAGRRKADTPAK